MPLSDARPACAEDMSPEDRAHLARLVGDAVRGVLVKHSESFAATFGFMPAECFVGGAIAGAASFAWAVKGEMPSAEMLDVVLDGARSAFAMMDAAAQMPPAEGNA
jgi:hypothetical protein